MRNGMAQDHSLERAGEGVREGVRVSGATKGVSAGRRSIW